MGPALERILTLRPERGSLHSTIQARINNLAVLAEFLTSDEKDKSCRSFTESARDTAAQRVHTYTGWLRTATTSGTPIFCLTAPCSIYFTYQKTSQISNKQLRTKNRFWPENRSGHWNSCKHFYHVHRSNSDNRVANRTRYLTWVARGSMKIIYNWVIARLCVDFKLPNTSQLLLGVVAL